ncbi:mCG142513, isoform CRA_a, partial [Mus musculus]
PLAARWSRGDPAQSPLDVQRRSSGHQQPQTETTETGSQHTSVHLLNCVCQILRHSNEESDQYGISSIMS